ncbi:hypothetical protein WJX72_008168 [[Myrmecia] bisecta]|uniref:Uncharacterized protein n=1 Tax=[Myrmecia] bisecta TaxID=41462 RepID=A0AAW1P8H8_9CHLO
MFREPDISTAEGRRHFKQPNRWNFLVAEPGSPGAYNAPDPRRDKNGFKAGWKHLRPIDAIQPDRERLEELHTKAVHQHAHDQVRHQVLENWNVYNGFDPVTGSELRADYKPPTLHDRQAMQRHAPAYATVDQVQALEARQARSAGIQSLRQQIGVKEGLVATHKADSVRDLLYQPYA